MAVRAPLRRHGDLALGAALAVAMVVELLVRGDGRLWISLPSAAFAGLSLVLRRRTPLAVFLLVMAGLWGIGYGVPGWDNISMTFIITFFVALYSLGAHADGREMWLGAVVVAIGVVVFVMNDGDPFYPGDVPFAIALVGGPWAAGLAIKLRRDRELKLSEENRQLELDQEDSARRAVAAERARIARDLHDVVSHAISVTVLQARGGRRMVGVDDAQVRRALDAIEQTNRQALGDMRRLLSLLRDTDTDDTRPDPQPSLARLDALVTSVRDSGLPVRLEVDGRCDAVPPGVDLTAYRIVQEALTNVIKHAGRRAEASVLITYGAADLDLRVSNTGTSAPNGSGGQGLVGIRERVAVVGGEVDIGSGDSGFVVHARLPYTVER